MINRIVGLILMVGAILAVRFVSANGLEVLKIRPPESILRLVIPRS